jgi:hypothetical protein
MEINISQDIRKYKTKDIGNFSFKEAGFLVIGFGLAFITYKITNSLEVSIFPFAIVAVFAFLKPYGMTCWQFLRTVGKEKLVPRTLINETDYVYDMDELRKEYKDFNVVDTDELIQSSAADNKKPNKFEEDLIIR